MLRVTLVLLLLPFTGIFAQELPLYNGSEYTAYYHGYRGHPYFKSDSLFEGEVNYEGIVYKNVLLGYNIADDVVYIRDNLQGFNLRLLNEKISWFVVDGKKFVNVPDSKGVSPGFYELIFDGHVKGYISRKKKLKVSINAEEPMHFVQYDNYFVESNGRIKEVNGIGGIISALEPENKEELKKYAKSQNINYRKQPEEAIKKLADYYERHTAWKEAPVVAKQQVVTKPTVQKITSLEENKIFEIGSNDKQTNKSTVTLAGYIKDSKTGESIIGATVSAGKDAIVLTDQFGYYSLSLPRGRHVVIISSSGMNDVRRQINLNEDGKLDVELSGKVSSLKAVIVVAEKNSNVKSTQMSVEKLTIKTIKQVPVIFGEADVLRVVTTLPGVTSAGEAGTGFNVRGGSVDQNLILFNEATIYNPSHVFGFFSAFNPDLIKSVELYKSTIPEKFGGRLSSVLDVSTREGNSKKISGVGGIGPLTSKLMLEGPVFSEKTTFITGIRTTYSNWLLRSLPKDYRNSTASFYDISLNVSHAINPKNNIYLTGYISNDGFRLNNDTSYHYGNTNWNLKWKHIFNNKIYVVFTGGQDHYKYSIRSKENPVNAFRLGFNVNQSHFRTAFSYSPSNNHQLDFGFNSIYYKLQPGTYEPNSSQSLVVSKKLQSEQGLESAIYIGDNYTVNSNLSFNIGIRYSMFSYLGPSTVYQYTPGIPKDTSTISDSIYYGGGKVIKTYQGPEYRMSARYTLTESSSVKLSFNTTRQYIHMLSNTTIVSPTDTWKLSDGDVKPQEGTQYSVGFYKNFQGNAIETSVEAYYKTMKNVLDYKSGARLIMNQHIAADVISAKGRSYGLEFMIKKTSGKLNGWISYTYSKTELKQDDPNAGEMINRGEYYPASFDKPHNVNFIGNYRFTHRFSLSMNVVYTTGRPITLPVAIFDYGGSQRVFYSDRNQYRIPDYFRSDISFTLEGNHKVKQRTHNSWSFGIYNLTARKNPYSVYFNQVNGEIKGYQLSIFGTMIPFVTYNFRF
jgi:hypothetical protein